MNDKLESMLDEMEAEGYEKGPSWEGYNVYIPTYRGDPKIGLPYVILEKGGRLRISSPDESLEYLDFMNTHKQP